MKLLIATTLTIIDFQNYIIPFYEQKQKKLFFRFQICNYLFIHSHYFLYNRIRTLKQ